jgi:hypothetical protein
MTRKVLATRPRDKIFSADEVICAMPIAIASPFAVISTTCTKVNAQSGKRGSQENKDPGP